MTLALPPPVTRVRWTRDRYVAAYQAGLVEEATELIDGDIVTVPNPDSPHEVAIRKLVRMLRAAIQGEDGFEVEKNCVIALGPEDQPACDVAIVRDDLYDDGHPTPNDVYLLVEVANSHPTRDRKVKLPRYALHNIQDYWIVDLQKGELVVCRQPSGNGYDDVRASTDDAIRLVRLPEVIINTQRLTSWLFE